MSLHIARLQLRLPAACAARGPGIARAVAEALARIPLGEARRIDVLHVGPVAVSDVASDQDVAAAAARGLAAQLRSVP